MPVWLRSRGLKRRSVRHPALAWRAEVMLRTLGLEAAELSVLLCDDATIRKLNRRYRKMNKATDVLAFPMQDDSGPEGNLLGDVVISLPTAARQARERDRPIIEEVTFLLAHGLLHLIGYDHRTAAEESDMNARGEALMEAVRSARRTREPVDKRS